MMMMMMMMILRSSVWHRCCTLLVLLLLALTAGTAAAGQGRATLTVSSDPNTAIGTVTTWRAMSQSETLDLYTLKAFAVSMTSASIQNADFLPLESMSFALKEVTEKYLKEFFDSQAMHDEAQASPLEALQVESVDLQVSLRRPAQRQRQLQRRDLHAGRGGLWAEVHGSAAFRNTETTQTVPSRDVAEAYLASLMEKAFAGSYLELYMERIEASGEFYFQNLLDFNVTTNITPPTQVVQIDDDGDWSALEYSLLAVMLFLLLSCIFSVILYVRMHRERTDKTVYSQDQSHDFYGSDNLACMAERGIHVTPSNSSSPRSYANVTSPLAAVWASLTTTGTHSPSTQQGPMMYPLEDDDVDAVDHHIHRAGPFTQQEGGSLASWVKSLSASFRTGRQEEEEEEVVLQFMSDENGKSFIYRDFPRHDGTPCLIYNESPPTNPRSRANSKTTMWASSSHSPKSTTTNSLENSNEVFKQRDGEEGEGEDIDSFVDRLEQLMVVRHEQYQERCSMEREREMRKRQRTYSRDGPVITVQEAEAALEEFLSFNTNADAPAVVTPLTSPQNQEIYQEQLVTEDGRIDQAMMRSQKNKREGWGEDDSTISGIMT